MVVHLSPKAKALTLPLNWSQFLKTLIGAENYTLFQLPPNKTGVRPLLDFAILCCLSRLLLLRSISATRIFLFPPMSNRSKYRDRAAMSVWNGWKFYRETRREISRYQLRDEVSIVY